MIEFRNVFKRYQPNSWAVEDVSFIVPKGKITCLIGPSGCGKTTLLRMVNRLIKPTQGEILVSGEPVMQMDPILLRRSIGYVIQQGGLLPHLNVRENIALLLRVLKRMPQEIQKQSQEAMERVNLDPSLFATRFPWELSGGQQQRVGIARALVTNPQLLLMDEPFGALDPITRRSLRDECIAINQSLDKTILLVTHDLSEAFELGDVIVLMNQGKIEQMGTQAELLESPKSPFVEEFVHTHIELGVR